MEAIPGGNLLGALGPWAMFIALAWWIIRNQAEQMKAKDERYDKLSVQVLALAQTVATMVGEMRRNQDRSRGE